MNVLFTANILHIKIIILIIQFHDYNIVLEVRFVVTQEYKYGDSTVDKILYINVAQTSNSKEEYM